MKRTIYSTWIDYKEFEGDEIFEELTENEKWDYCCEAKRIWLEDETENLDKIIPGIPVYIADLGLWNGRRAGYKTDENVQKIGEMLLEISSHRDYEAFDWYCENGDLRVAAYHHDGTNYFTLRYIPAAEKQEIIDQIMDGVISLEEMLRHTKSLEPLVNEVYGWTATAENPQEIAESMPA